LKQVYNRSAFDIIPTVWLC